MILRGTAVEQRDRRRCVGWQESCALRVIAGGNVPSVLPFTIYAGGSGLPNDSPPNSSTSWSMASNVPEFAVRSTSLKAVSSITIFCRADKALLSLLPTLNLRSPTEIPRRRRLLQPFVGTRSDLGSVRSAPSFSGPCRWLSPGHDRRCLAACPQGRERQRPSPCIRRCCRARRELNTGVPPKVAPLVFLSPVLCHGRAVRVDAIAVVGLLRLFLTHPARCG